jgi:hypothetical protein
MHKKKNQKPTTNPVAQKQADTSQTKRPKPTQAPPTPQKEEDKISKNAIYKVVNIYYFQTKLTNN